jgi:predicted metal-dependent peptidase
MSSVFRVRHQRSEIATQLIMEKSPAMGGLLLWARHADGNEEGQIACTDGRTIWYEPLFPELPIKEQGFVVNHEMLHIAFCHPQRAAILRMREEDFNHQAWNMAADAIINNALVDHSWISMPQDKYKGPLLREWLETWRRLDPNIAMPAAHEWDTETLYRFLMDPKGSPALKSHIESLKSEFGAGDIKILIRITDMANAEQEIRDWARRLKTAVQGDRPDGILRRLEADIPKTRTPWQHHLRQMFTSVAAPQTETTWNRPSRRYLALRAVKPIPYEEGTRSKERPRVVVIVDTSGSIDAVLFHEFISEIATIMNRTGAEVIVIVSDAAVHGTYTLRDRESEIRKIEFKGGGGTDFRPGLEEAAKYKPAACVYLTDLMGTFPDHPPRFRTIWAVPNMFEASQVPFGSKIVIAK